MSVRLPKRGPVPNPRAALLATVSETEFQNAVIAWAKRGGWLVSAMREVYVWHPHDEDEIKGVLGA